MFVEEKKSISNKEKKFKKIFFDVLPNDYTSI